MEENTWRGNGIYAFTKGIVKISPPKNNVYNNMGVLHLPLSWKIILVCKKNHINAPPIIIDDYRQNCNKSKMARGRVHLKVAKQQQHHHLHLWKIVDEKDQYEGTHPTKGIGR